MFMSEETAVKEEAEIARVKRIVEERLAAITTNSRTRSGAGAVLVDKPLDQTSEHKPAPLSHTGVV